MERDELLVKTHVEITITDLIAEYEIELHLKNRSKTDRKRWSSNQLETYIFRFPIPINSVFIGMLAEINGEVFTSQMMPEGEAITQINNGICEDNPAIMMKFTGDGLFYINLRDLLYEDLDHLFSSSNGIIKLKFVNYLTTTKNIAHFSIPAINHPRCGLGWKEPPPKITNYDLNTDSISVRMQVTGLLEDSVIKYTSPPIQEQENTLNFILMNNMLDQDFTVQFKTTSPLPAQCYLTPENDHYIGLFNLIAPQTKPASSDISLELIMDCSGSMYGDAIIQSQKIANAILAQLNQEDYIQVTQFCDDVYSLLERPTKAIPQTINYLKESIKTLHANLGGTPMNFAIETALKQLQMVEHANKVIILVTDGDIYPSEIQKIITTVANTNVRIFIILTGGAANIHLLTPLINATNGAVEYTTPCEPIESCVKSILAKTRELTPCNINIHYPGNSTLLPIDTFYPNDDVIGMFKLPQQVEQIAVTVNNKQQNIPCRIYRGDNSTISALYGYHLYHNAPESQKEAIALQYNLLTPHTSAILTTQPKEDCIDIRLLLETPEMHSQEMSMPSKAIQHYDNCYCIFYTPTFLTWEYSDRTVMSFESLISYAKNLDNPIEYENISDSNLARLESAYLILYINRIETPEPRAIYMGTNTYTNKIFIYFALGFNSVNQKELLGLWITENPSDKAHWYILEELKQRGLKDIDTSYINHLSGMSDAIKMMYPDTIVENIMTDEKPKNMKCQEWSSKKETELKYREWNHTLDLQEVYRTIDQYLRHGSLLFWIAL